MTDRVRSRLAWRDGDIVMLSVTTFVGLIAIVGGWLGTSGTASSANQALWLNVAIGGLVVSSAGVCLWLLQGRGAVGERRAALVSLDVGGDQDALPSRGGKPSPSIHSLALVRADGMSRVHAAACPLVVGKPVRRAHHGDGELCRICCDD